MKLDLALISLMYSSSTSLSRTLVCEIVDARPQNSLGIFKRKDVRDGPEVVPMGLVDGGAIQLSGQLGNGMITVVHPDLDDVHLLGGIFIDVLARFGNGGDPIGSLRASGFWAGETASGGVVARGVGDGLGTHLVYLVAGILAEAHRGADAVVREMLQLIH